MRKGIRIWILKKISQSENDSFQRKFWFSKIFRLFGTAASKEMRLLIYSSSFLLKENNS